MRVLVVGGTRFIGPEVVRHLSDLGCEVTLFHRGQTPADLARDVREILGDRRHLADFSGEFRRVAPHVVLDMIPLGEWDARTVMRIFAGIAGRVVAISSQDVYRAYGRLDRSEPGPQDPVPLPEDARLREKLYPYRDEAEGEDDWRYRYDKILVERVVMNDPDLPGTILRLPMVYGPRDPYHRLFKYLKRMDDQRPAIIFGEELSRWRWSRGYVENLGAAIAQAVTDDRATARIYNVAEAEALSEADWVMQIGQAAGWHGQVVRVPENRLPPHLRITWDAGQHLVTDTARIRRDLGYTELVPRNEALQRTIAWERAHPPETIDSTIFDYGAEGRVLDELDRRAYN